MGEVDARELGARIRAARERAGLKQGELGQVVDLDRTAVNKIEGGLRKVTALELSEIAIALGVRMSSFFADPVPAIVSHRAAAGVQVADSNVDRHLSRLADDVEFLASLCPEELGLNNSEELRRTLPQTRLASTTDAEQLASNVRGLVGLDPDQPVLDIVDRAASIGLLVFSADMGPDTPDAGTILLRQGGVGLVNSHSKLGRRRLAAAHELGHYLAQDDYTVDWRIAGQSGTTEARLDRFARAFLLPSAAIAATWASYAKAHELREAAVLAGSEFRVDMATLARRLLELSAVSEVEADAIRNVTTTQTDIVEFGLVVPLDLSGTSLPRPFQKAVLRAFRDERISRERALELLQDTFRDDDLPSLRPRRDDEIWKFVS